MFTVHRLFLLVTEQEPGDGAHRLQVWMIVASITSCVTCLECYGILNDNPQALRKIILTWRPVKLTGHFSSLIAQVRVFHSFFKTDVLKFEADVNLSL